MVVRIECREEGETERGGLSTLFLDHPVLKGLRTIEQKVLELCDAQVL
jgi:hypothetical protein